MTAHELAKELLEGPDLPVVIPFDDWRDKVVSSVEECRAWEPCPTKGVDDQPHIRLS